MVTIPVWRRKYIWFGWEEKSFSACSVSLWTSWCILKLWIFVVARGWIIFIVIPQLLQYTDAPSTTALKWFRPEISVIISYLPHAMLFCFVLHVASCLAAASRLPDVVTLLRLCLFHYFPWFLCVCCSWVDNMFCNLSMWIFLTWSQVCPRCFILKTEWLHFAAPLLKPQYRDNVASSGCRLTSLFFI